MGRRGRIVAGVGVVLAAAIGVAYVYLGELVLAMAAPGVPFERAKAPPGPDYADPANWSALPGRADAGDATVAGFEFVDQGQAPVDVFYLHPTSYLGSSWNARMDDATVNEATDRGGTRIQASAFAGCCAVYAPRYRQANMTAFTRVSEDGRAAIGLAGDDVVAAFEYYLEHYNRGRPFIIAGHSQGSVMGTRLLAEVIAPGALRERLVAAYLIGGSLTEATLAAIPGVPACGSATDTGCVVAFNARSPAYAGGIDFVETDARWRESPRACTSPLSWRADGSAAGAVYWDGEVVTRMEGPLRARCEGGFLRVETRGKVPRDFMSRLLDHALGDGNYHPIEYGLFWVDLYDNARARVAAFLARPRG